MIIRVHLLLLFWSISFLAQAQLGLKEDSLMTPSGSMADTLIVDTYLELADRLSFKEPDEAYKYGQEALAVAKKIDDYYGVMSAYNMMGTIEVYRGKFEEAKEVHRLALDVAKTNDDVPGMVTAYVAIATVLSEQNKLISALQIYDKAMMLADSMDCSCGEGDLYNNVAGIYVEIDSLEKSKIYYEKALTIYEETEEELGIATAYINLGDYYLKKKNYAEAERYFYKSLAIYKTNNDPETGFFAYLNIGIVNGATKNYLVAQTYMDSAAYITSNDNSLYHKAIMGIEQGKLYFNQGRWQQAERYLSNALELSEQLGARFMQKEAAAFLYQVQAQNGDYKNAFKNLEFVKNTSDSLNALFNSSQMHRLEESFELQQKEQSIALAEQKELAAKNRSRFLWALGMLGILLLLGLLCFYLYRQKVKTREAALERDKLSGQLKLRNKELTSKVMYLARKNELIRNISSRLAENQRNLSASNRKVVQEVIHELKTGEDDDIWREFELRFIEVHQSFYKKVKTTFPNLSQNEMRLCAFLKLNLSTKDIASITFQSIGSIEVARARLRKKLGIGNTTTNLTEFIHSL